MQIVNTNKLPNVDAISGFLGSENNNPNPFQGLLNVGTSTLSAKEQIPVAQNVQNNGGAIPQTTSSSGGYQVVENPWGYYYQGGFNYEGLDMSNNQSLSNSPEPENQLPELVSGSPEASPVNQMENKTDAAPDSTVYEAWEKLIMEDDWKDILE
ncbi:hypothetical protein COLO4_16982 [Corchorus olitorius]|uniref:Uncharacterized protein n=1 Tax=Corchorus olitorius TaxID=93759 RepID=A0A1R3JEN9_9ROSI|nr:hypothetical protein COLO4_16982 [Corchorus olitorius]